MNDFTIVFQNQRPAVAALMAVSLMLAGSALAADSDLADSLVADSAVAAQPMVAATNVSAKTATTKVASGDAADEKRITKLHDSLKITQQQEALWGTVADTMRVNDDRIDALSTKRHDHAATMTAVEDLASYGEMSQAHAESVKAFHASFVPLYDAMSSSQKTNADQVFRSAGMKGHKKAL
jgi:hypothetical protein